MSEFCKVYFSEDGKHFVKMPNGDKIPKIIEAKVEQDIEEARAGVARVTLTIWCRTTDE